MNERVDDGAGNAGRGATHIGPFVVRGPVVRKPKAKAKVTLCHKGRTIKVPKSQVRQHRKHGDKAAPVPEEAEAALAEGAVWR